MGECVSGEQFAATLEVVVWVVASTGFLSGLLGAGFMGFCWTLYREYWYYRRVKRRQRRLLSRAVQGVRHGRA